MICYDMSKGPCDFAMTCQKVLEPRFMPTTSEAMATKVHCQWHVAVRSISTFSSHNIMLPIVIVRGLLDD